MNNITPAILRDDFETLFVDPTIAMVELTYEYTQPATSRDTTRSGSSYTIRVARDSGSVSTGYTRVGTDRFHIDNAHALKLQTMNTGSTRLAGYRIVAHFDAE